MHQDVKQMLPVLQLLVQLMQLTSLSELDLYCPPGQPQKVESNKDPAKQVPKRSFPSSHADLHRLHSFPFAL